jgi:hypothetical protein
MFSVVILYILYCGMHQVWDNHLDHFNNLSFLVSHSIICQLLSIHDVSPKTFQAIEVQAFIHLLAAHCLQNISVDN